MMRIEMNNIKWVTLGAIAITLISLYPQLLMWTTRGAEWNGAYAENQGDEWLYSAYIQALIDGRARRSDPYTGQDDKPGTPQPESLFSIQFVPAYFIAIPARIFGLSSSTAFIILGILASLCAYLSILWILTSITEDSRIAAVGSLVVLCFGTLAARQGLVHIFSSDIQYAWLPFLRRYEPAAVFPVFFVFCGAVWKSKEQESKAMLWSTLAGILFVTLIFGYFYLWTAALAWLACLFVVSVVAFPERWWLEGKRFLIVVLTGVAGMVPYIFLLTRRSASMESGQKLTVSHAPDFFRGPEILGLAVIALIVFGCYKKRIDWRQNRILFALSFALMPFACFNQQVLTGLSLQPFHYEMFIANYVVLAGAVLVLHALIGELQESKLKKLLAYAALIAFWWGMMEVVLPSRVIKRNNEFADRSAAVGHRLRSLASTQGITQAASSIALVTDTKLAIILPTFAPQSVLWAPQFDFLHLESGESRERYYKYLYYCGIKKSQLEEELRQPINPFAAAAFGHERVIPDLAVDVKPITSDEIALELGKYESFSSSFTREKAASHLLSYVVATAEDDLSNLDRWYERDQGERIGSFIVYRVRLRE
jgi:hypothetical protein